MLHVCHNTMQAMKIKLATHVHLHACNVTTLTYVNHAFHPYLYITTTKLVYQYAQTQQ
jgi:hypothetical protein